MHSHEWLRIFCQSSGKDKSHTQRQCSDAAVSQQGLHGHVSAHSCATRAKSIPQAPCSACQLRKRGRDLPSALLPPSLSKSVQGVSYFSHREVSQDTTARGLPWHTELLQPRASRHRASPTAEEGLGQTGHRQVHWSHLGILTSCGNLVILLEASLSPPKGHREVRRVPDGWKMANITQVFKLEGSRGSA